MAEIEHAMAPPAPADSASPLTVHFRCPPELSGLLPPPLSATLALPDWFKAMPQKAFNPIAQEDSQTVKRCPPFIDAMTCGFLIPLLCDLKVENGEFSWDADLPTGGISFVRSPIGFHDPSQVAGTPLFDEDRFLIKFHNLWTIETPPGYSLLFTHPINRFDLPFITLTGLIDTDLYCDNWVHIPAYWRDPGFSGVLPKGTPVAQCLPIKRESWTAQTEALSEQDAERVHQLSNAVAHDAGIYRKQFRAAKR